MLESLLCKADVLVASIFAFPFEILTRFQTFLEICSTMYIVPMAWLYVALMMAVAEANHPTGTLLGALMTFVLYGVGPVLLVVYLMGTPGRRRAIKSQEAAELVAANALKDQAQAQAQDQAQDKSQALAEPDAGSQAATDTVAPVREKP